MKTHCSGGFLWLRGEVMMRHTIRVMVRGIRIEEDGSVVLRWVDQPWG